MAKVENGQSLNQSMGNAVRHYSSLFSLPSLKKTLLILAVICIGFGGFSNLIIYPSIEGLVFSFSVGVSLFAATLLIDYGNSHFIMREDPIFTIRRSMVLSLVCWVLWLVFIGFGVLFAGILGFWWWLRFLLFGYGAVLTLRAVVFFSVSTVGFVRGAFAVILEPFICILPFLFSWVTIGEVIAKEHLLFLLVAPFLSLAFAFLFVSLIDRQGQKSHEIPSMKLFKAFMQNWVIGLNEPIERYLEQLGEDEDIEVSILMFNSSKPKAAIIVPKIHPGPFKNIGSSILPSMLKHEFEKECGCEACVPLGLMGHELDLTSQRQNHKVVDGVLSSANNLTFSDRATPFIRVSNNVAAANCQVFGKTAFLSFTLAPKTTEDLPQQLSKKVQEEAKKLGFDSIILVNTHNSILDEPYTEVPLEFLSDVASKALIQASSLVCGPFAVGAATVYPRDFSLKDGMGQGGITCIVVKVAQQRIAYVVIDSNNMISGLRERINSELIDFGFDNSEVFTTDTHAVSAVVLGRRGYHPIGEAIDHDLLLRCIKGASSKALENLEVCRAGSLSVVVPQVRVIGQDKIQSLSKLVDSALKRAKQLVVPIFAFEGLVLALLLYLI